jgi:hypothetical protein
MIKVNPAHAAPELQAEYAASSRRLADERAVLSGYRLGDGLRGLLD